MNRYGKGKTVMEMVTISPKFQVVIPAKIRRLLHLQPGQKVHMVVYDNRIELIPIRPITEAYGFLAGIDTTVEREPDRI
jgi:AbrB family looped-hinge helix DNA binding protein